nr:2-oxoglutarate dehydrogenase, E1' {N-terminal} [cattle, heart, Peptide Partial, 21 aa] [Bos taurus]
GPLVEAQPNVSSLLVEDDLAV